MHESKYVIEIVNTALNFAKKNGVTRIHTLVIQIGELSAVVPHQVEECYLAAVEGNMLKDTELEIEILPGNAICKRCNNVFRVITHDKTCPECGSKNEFKIISGKELRVKKIIAC